LYEDARKIPFQFQLIYKELDLAYDGIIGRNFLWHTQARICYENNTVVLKTPYGEWVKGIGDRETVGETAK
jgi:hypothetical protein